MNPNNLFDFLFKQDRAKVKGLMEPKHEMFGIIVDLF